MVRHDGPCVQPVAVGIKPQESGFDQYGDPILPESAGTPTLIEKLVSQALGPSCPTQRQCGFLRQAVGEPEGHELHDILGVEMREVTSRVPTLMIHSLNGSGMVERCHHL